MRSAERKDGPTKGGGRWTNSDSRSPLKSSRFTRPSSLVSLLLLILIFPFAAHADLVDRVVASVNNDVITLSELNRAVSFNTALGGARENIREETLEGLINRCLLIQDSRRLRFVEVSEQDIETEIEKLKKRLGSEDAFKNFLVKVEATGEQMGRMLGERLLVERFVEKKIGLYVRVSRDEAQDYFNSNPDTFRDKFFPDVQKAITAHLQGLKLEKQISRYLAELKNKADVRVNL